MQHPYRGRLAKWHGSFGFIRYEGRDVFVHFKNYLGGFHPELNQFVEFDLGPAVREDKPEQAIRVRVLRTAVQVEAKYTAGVNALNGQGGEL
jgi:hypothetical protein